MGVLFGLKKYIGAVVESDGRLFGI